MHAPDVVVIGAGAAGLAAADTLGRSGLHVTIVEARERCGGRVYTTYPSSAHLPIELGAEFVHGQPPEIMELATSTGLRMVEVPEERWELRDARITRRDDFWSRFDDILAFIEESLDGDSSFQEIADAFWREPDCADIKRDALAYVQGFNAADPSDISARSVADMESANVGDGSFRFVEGYGEFIEHLRLRLDPRHVEVRSNTVVDAIHWTHGSVEVLAHSKPASALTLKAPKAVITLPLGVLQAGPSDPAHVRFAPELISKQAALDQLAMGQVIRVSLQLRDEFWRAVRLEAKSGAARRLSSLAFLRAPDEAFPTWWTPLPIRAPLLTAWAGGSRAESAIPQGDAARQSAAIAALANILRLDHSRVEAAVEQCHTHDWHADPYARGAYTYVRTGGSLAPSELAEPIDATLYFAGEAMAPEFQYGTVHGAIGSGRRAAREVIESFRA